MTGVATILAVAASASLAGASAVHAQPAGQPASGRQGSTTSPVAPVTAPRTTPAHPSLPRAIAAREGARASVDTTNELVAPPDGDGSGLDPLLAATRDYRAGGAARTVVQGHFVVFPFGHAQPTLTCAVLRVCVIELQPGEIVLSRIAGDTERWEITPAPAGPDGRTTLVVVKPRDCDLTTNLVLATDHRLYDLTLDAPPCDARRGASSGTSRGTSTGGSATNPQQPYVRHVRFYYPDETVAAWTASPATPVAAGARRAANPPVDLARLDFGYRVQRDRRILWAPAQVFDDGARVYLKLPEAARHAEAPALFVLEADGSRTFVNYTVVGDTYVTDRLFDRAVLVTSVGGKERRVVIERSPRREAP